MELSLDQALKQGVEAHKAGKLQEADRYYTAILKAQPKNPDANHNMGVLAVSVNKIEESLPFFKAALETNPNIAQFWLSYIDALIKLNKVADAKLAFDQAKINNLKNSEFDQIQKRLTFYNKSKKNCKDPRETPVKILDKLNLNKALKLAKKNVNDGLSQEAKKIYQDILKQFPKNKKAIDGLIYLSKKIKPKSSKIKDPPQAQLQNLIDIYTQGHFQKALSKSFQLLKDYPNSINLYNIIGAANKALGKLEEAKEAYYKVISIVPDYADAYNNMGNVLKDQGKQEAAFEAYKKAISLKPNFAEAFNNMGVSLQNLAKFTEAIEAYKKALSIKFDYAEAFNNMGVSFQNLDKFTEAIEAYKKAISLKPNFAEAYYNMGVAFQNLDKLEKALDALNKVISIKPHFAEAYYNIGNVLKDQVKLKEAIDAFNKTLSLKPDFYEAYNNMGIALKDQGKITEAIEAYNKALTIKPNCGTAKHMLSALTGNINKTAPREFVEKLFDGYSHTFEASLVDKLEYKIPKLIKDILIKPTNKETLGSVLDLGCGTGLFGTEVKNYCSKLEGIDLSKKMLAIANQKNVYDKLIQTDIVEYLSTMPLDFDYYIALDVFIYVGELTEIFKLIKSRNKKSGHLVFSTEHTENDGYHIHRTARYSHSKSYIENLCEKFDYSISHFSTNHLRKEKGEFLKGGIYVLSFKPY